MCLQNLLCQFSWWNYHCGNWSQLEFHDVPICLWQIIESLVLHLLKIHINNLIILKVLVETTLEKLYTPTRWQLMLNLYSTIVDQMLNPQMPHKWSTNDLHLQDLNLIRLNKPTWPLAFSNKQSQRFCRIVEKRLVFIVEWLNGVPFQI
jgi:hypothetical protein